MRVLCLLPFPPDLGADHGGGRVCAQLVHHLARRHEVAVLHLWSPEAHGPRPDALEGLAFLEAVRLPAAPASFAGRARGALHARLGLVAGRPLWNTGVASREMSGRIAAITAEWRPQVVQAHFAVMARYLADVRRDPMRVLVDLDPGEQAARDRLRSGFRRPLDRADRWAWRRFQPRAMRLADAVVVLSERDRTILQPVAPAARIEVIGPGFDAPATEVARDEAHPPCILFVGNFAHPPNVEAAHRLVEHIFPAVRRSVPACRLRIVGPDPPAELRLPRDGVEVTGRVPAVEPLLAAAAVVAVPIAGGGGVRVKVLEALAAGVPVVASQRALEGIPVTDGVHAVVAETDEEFADRIAWLLLDEAERLRTGARAREWARRNSGWDAPLERFEALYRASPARPR